MSLATLKSNRRLPPVAPADSRRRPHRRLRPGLLSVFSAVILSACAGCPATQSLPAHPIQELTEIRTKSPYLFYAPSVYRDDQSWPLIVLCHGTWPFDRADLQMREWAKFAEYEGLIIAAPVLASTRGDFPPPPEKQRRLQAEDDERILAMVSEIKRRYRIAEERVFLTGWSAGAYVILNTGLKHPDVFRALYVRQGNFDERYMDIPESRLSRWQPIKLVYGKVDMLRDQTKAAVQWLRDQGLWVEEQEITGFHRRIDPKHAWHFFEKIIRERPWIRIRALRADPAKPLTVQFELDAVPEAVKQKWFFGDGGESYDRPAVHTYARPGQYTVSVNVALKGGKVYNRGKTIRIPRRLPGG